MDLGLLHSGTRSIISSKMRYDFDKIVERRGSDCVKYDALKSVYGREDLTPLWVADMDFETPDFIINAIKERLDHPILGYGIIPEEFWQSIIDWQFAHNAWKIDKESLRFIPGIVKGIALVINAMTQPGDKVIIQTPVYHPFRIVPQKNGREVVYNSLKELPNGSYEMDFDNLEQVCDERCKVLILSNPHNPAGIVWSKDSLQQLASFCHSHGVLVISDEIHSDMVLWGGKHIPFATVSKEAADCSITFAAPSKTFNIAGVVSSYSVVLNPEIRDRFYHFLDANEMDSPHIFAPAATIAAFRQGEQWRRQMLEYIEGNIIAIEDFCKTHLPQIKPLRPQASFLVWLDCRGLKMSQEQLQILFVQDAHLALNDGEMFGEQGRGFMRLNVGCPRSVLMQAMESLKTAIEAW